MADKSNRATIKSTLRTLVAAISNIGNIYLEEPYLKSDSDIKTVFYDTGLDVCLGGWVHVPVGQIQETELTVGQNGYNVSDMPVEFHYLYAIDGGPTSATDTSALTTFESKLDDIAQVLRQNGSTLFASSGLTPRPHKTPGAEIVVEQESPYPLNESLWVYKGKVTVTVRDFLTR